VTDIPRADALVIFGATGDLAKRKILPALYQLACRDQLDMPVVGVSRSTDDDEEFRAHVRDSVTAAVKEPDEKVLDKLLGRIHLVCGDYGDEATFQALSSVLAEDDTKLPVFYLAIPPSQFEVVIESLSKQRLTETGRVVVEKPFGRDLQSARELNEVLHAHLPEDRIFRIDHYLGKEAIEDLLIFRFANTFLEPIWNRNYVDSVQITMAESIGVEGRGSFYDSVGTLRDVVQNHLLQIVALLAMEPPVGPAADNLSDEKVKVFRAMRDVDPTQVVRGQYQGYLDEPGVDAGSTTETYVACRLAIESWRWAGVPFYVRAGKALATSSTEAVIRLKQPPAVLFGGQKLAGDNSPGGNVIRFRLGSADGVTMTVNAKQPGPELEAKEVDLSVDFASALGIRQEPYERLIGDALDGNLRRFGREDIVEETWRVVQPILDHPGPIRHYERGSWGPEAADALLEHGDWVGPKTSTGA
jgi:glucose-6-phosphate 1-dehydrogenase